MGVLQQGATFYQPRTPLGLLRSRLTQTTASQCNVSSLEMNCAKVLHAFSGHPQQAVMPVDLAVRLCLSQGQPLYQLLSMSHLGQPADCPPRSNFHSLRHSSSSSSSSSRTSEPRSCFRRDGRGPNKKRVVFADAKGLALTAVRLFVPDSSSPPGTLVMKRSPATLQQGQQQLPSIKGQRYKLRLGFLQPTLDYNVFLARLQETLVQLESCVVTEYSLSGTVCACNISSEKAVHLRVTFDSWRSHRDVPCTYLQQPYGSCDMDVFAFDVALPQNLNPTERVEFCVSFRPGVGATPRWDDNRGQNYRLCMEVDQLHQGLAAHRSPRRIYQPPSWTLVTTKGSADLSSEKFIKHSWGRVENSF
ncbi:protein phosphatase 1 regulatory subunit 3C-B [Diretmus argenteus]